MGALWPTGCVDRQGCDGRGPERPGLQRAHGPLPRPWRQAWTEVVPPTPSPAALPPPPGPPPRRLRPHVGHSQRLSARSASVRLGGSWASGGGCWGPRSPEAVKKPGQPL